ncbi:4-hydroxythreonine-4-phosphate dehydrogenase PdxA [Ideonella sp. YS5]|uniref:4-hydroxythreonine-4-phosphate dehydrogenase PdxA n=1 Tax=Ideonella sp. YS5 TaxID=3453714 RepID=UPI003EF0513E
MRMIDQPLLVTMGDPSGIGPEIIAKAWASSQLGGAVVCGDLQVMRRALATTGITRPVAALDSPIDLPAVPEGALPVWQPEGLPAGLSGLPWGQISPAAGAAAARCIECATAQVLAGRARALVTAPIHKEALAAAGVDFPGHTEMLQALAARHAGLGQAPAVRMMLANEELRVVLVTIHVSLRRAIDLLDTPGILQTLRITHEAGRRFGLAAPRIAVAGLNPHAGEGGLFGDEELSIIAPAIQAARDEGIDASGPYAPDTVFMRARHAAGHPGEFDFVVAMTHDHGLIPVKYLGVEHGVNVTLGLPFVRTSPDHGTAFDIAGTGRADPSSLVAATAMACRLAAA